MHPIDDGFTEEYPAGPEAVPHARAALTRFAVRAGVGGEQLDGIRLAVSEAVTCAVTHDHPRPVRVCATADARRFLITVSDGGHGIRLAPEPEPDLGLIAKVSDQVAIGPCAAGGSELRIRFDVDSARRVGAL